MFSNKTKTQMEGKVYNCQLYLIFIYRAKMYNSHTYRDFMYIVHIFTINVQVPFNYSIKYRLSMYKVCTECYMYVLTNY